MQKCGQHAKLHILTRHPSSGSAQVGTLELFSSNAYSSNHYANIKTRGKKMQNDKPLEQMVFILPYSRT